MAGRRKESLLFSGRLFEKAMLYFIISSADP